MFTKVLVGMKDSGIFLLVSALAAFGMAMDEPGEKIIYPHENGPAEFGFN